MFVHRNTFEPIQASANQSKHPQSCLTFLPLAQPTRAWRSYQGDKASIAKADYFGGIANWVITS
ncbi:hypothetical protein N9D38_10740 [Rubripirellula sp.]|jgi:hypothetical protein|nr:hypothetical protein [Rubripirellula sp.]